MCKIAKSKDWATRIMHETSYFMDNIFITLTYNDENLPKNKSISKKELVNFIKRLRKHTNKSLKYYGCGEYGGDESKKRPHYHAIIFGLSEKDFEFDQYIHNNTTKRWEKSYKSKSWMKNKKPIGNIHIGNVEYDSARYVADYTMKNSGKYYGDKVIEEYGGIYCEAQRIKIINNRIEKGKIIKNRYGGREQPFQIFSKGLGRQFAIDNEKYLKQKLGCTVNGKEVGLCKYYRNVLGIEGKEVFIEAERRKKNRELSEEEKLELKYIWQLTIETHNQLETKEIMQKIYDQRELNHKRSLEMRSKKL